jgi:hypothetical protein
MRRLGPFLLLILALATIAPGPVRAGTIDLLAEEAAGGHTIARHVGKSEAELRLRLAEEPHIPAASSFRNLEEAERFVSDALGANASRIHRWLEFARPGERLRIDYRADGVVGHGILRSTGQLEPMSTVVAILKRTSRPDRPYIVLTTYPEP